MDKVHRARPDHVLSAILANDTTTLRELGRRGLESQRRKRARNPQRVLKLTARTPKIKKRKTTRRELIEGWHLGCSLEMSNEALEFQTPLH